VEPNPSRRPPLLPLFRRAAAGACRWQGHAASRDGGGGSLPCYWRCWQHGLRRAGEARPRVSRVELNEGACCGSSGAVQSPSRRKVVVAGILFSSALPFLHGHGSSGGTDLGRSKVWASRFDAREAKFGAPRVGDCARSCWHSGDIGTSLGHQVHCPSGRIRRFLGCGSARSGGAHAWRWLAEAKNVGSGC
jgi:hypothetical protein